MVSLLFVNKQSVSWSIACEFKIRHVFRTLVRWHWAVCQISSLHVWVARKLGPLHFTLAYIVYRESRTRQVVYIHVHYGVHGEKYIGIDSCLIDLSLCCIICSQINTIRVLVSKPEVQIMNILSPHRVVVRLCSPVDDRDSTPWLENRSNERTI